MHVGPYTLTEANCSQDKYHNSKLQDDYQITLQAIVGNFEN